MESSRGQIEQVLQFSGCYTSFIECLEPISAVQQSENGQTWSISEALFIILTLKSIYHSAAQTCPLLYTTRISTAKMLIELEMLDEATQVLEGLVDEDDEVGVSFDLDNQVNFRVRTCITN